MPAPNPPADRPEDQARQQAGQQQVTVRIDERNMKTSYANAFRTNGTPEEIMIDFGVNVMAGADPQKDQGQPQVLFQVSDRVIMNYYSAKRLVLAVGEFITRHEQQFGTLELDVSRRRK